MTDTLGEPDHTCHHCGACAVCTQCGEEHTQRCQEERATQILEAKLRHPSYMPARERMQDWTDYQERIDPRRRFTYDD